MKLKETLVVAFCIALFIFIVVAYAQAGRQWVRGSSNGAKHCYAVGQENANIRYKIYFDTLDSCIASFTPKE